MNEFSEFWKKGGNLAEKSRVTKPAESVHTPKWDRCVAHVQQNNPDADPYAVCTAMLGDESFKAMDDAELNGLIDKALNQIGISAAGPIPHSKLARQDLEGSSTHKAMEGFTPQATLVGNIQRNQKAPIAKGSSFKDLWSRVKPR